jgi:hypothetical protein
VRTETIVVMLRGKPPAALTPTGEHTDMENLIVSNDPAFRALIERSRSLYKPGTGLTTEDVRRRLVAKRSARPKTRRRG